MPAVWTDDPTIGNALAGVANAAYSGPMVQLRSWKPWPACGSGRWNTRSCSSSYP